MRSTTTLCRRSVNNAETRRLSQHSSWSTNGEIEVRVRIVDPGIHYPRPGWWRSRSSGPTPASRGNPRDAGA